MAKFLAREYEYHTEEEDWTELKDEWDASSAAEAYAEEIWPYSDYQDTLVIEVKNPTTGEITIWDVEVEHQPHFYASHHKPKNK